MTNMRRLRIEDTLHKLCITITPRVQGEKTSRYYEQQPKGAASGNGDRHQRLTQNKLGDDQNSSAAMPST